METDDTPGPPPPSASLSPEPKRESLRGCGPTIFVFVLALIGWAGSQPYSRPTGSTLTLEARGMAAAIANSVEHYLTEYGRLPSVRPSPRAGEDTDADTSAAAGLIADLLGKEKGGGNTLGMDFLDGFKEAKTDPGKPAGWKNGLVYGETHYAIYDPWGRPFRVRLDTGGDRHVDNPDPDRVKQGKARLEKTVILWSSGKDGDWNTWRDNVTSWD